jgi:hypothetical protein
MATSKAKTKYFLWRAVLGSDTRLPLSVNAYERLERAWTTLTTLLAFEEEWDIVLQNYMELELGFLSSAMHSMVRSWDDTKEYRRARLNFGRLVANLLTSTRSYLDHSPHHLAVLGSDVSKSFVEKTNTAYKAEFGYRFMEALRNYAQHRGAPLHGVSWHSQRVERETEESFLQYSVGAWVNVGDLRSDPKFKKTVLSGFSDDESIDVLAMARIYTEKLGEIHAQCREELADGANDAKAALRAALDRYQQETGESRIAISFARSASDRTVDQHQTIPEDVIAWYESLVSSNRQIINLRNRFVSNELLPERDGRPRRR